jgi:translocation and assembly module TamB
MVQPGYDSSESEAERRPSSKWRVAGVLKRAWLPLLLSVAGLFSIAIGLFLWLLSNLDHPWIKGRVENALSDLVGTEVGYDRLSISPFSGLALKGLVLATPEGLRTHGLEMLRVDELEILIKIGPLLAGELVIPEVRGGAITLTVVITEDGQSSFGELANSESEALDEEPAGRSTPLSQSLAALEDIPLRVGPVRIEPIRLRLVHVENGAVASQTHLDAFAVSSDGIAFGSNPTASLSIGPSEGSDVVVSVLEPNSADSQDEGPTRRARIVPRAQARLQNGQALALSVAANLLEQSIFPELRPVRSLLDLEATAAFEPEEHKTTLDIDRLACLDSMLGTTGTTVVHDDLSARIEGSGTIEASSLPWKLPWLSIDDFAGEFEIEGLELGPLGITAGTATLQGKLDDARYESGSQTVTLRNIAVAGALSAPSDPAQTVGSLTLQTSVRQAGTRLQDRLAADLRGLGISIEIQGIGAHDTGMWGLKGTGSVDGSIERLSVKARDVTGARLASTASKLGMVLSVDLASQRVTGRMPLRSLIVRRAGLDPVLLDRSELAVVAEEPLDWAHKSGAPALEVEASVERVSMGERHFRAPAWLIEARRTDADRYAISTELIADRVSWGQFRQEPPSSLSVRAALDTKTPAIDATAALSIGAKPATNLALSASYDSPFTRYHLDLEGAETGPLAGALLFGDGGRRSDELRFSFESTGKLDGLLSRDRAGVLTVAPEPLRTARGTHRSALHIERLLLVREGVAYEANGLGIRIGSTHEAPGRGALEARASVERARYSDGIWSAALEDYAHELEVAYAALYGAPSFSIHTEGTLGNLGQTYLRQYPIRDVTFGADVDVDDTQVVAIRRAFLRNPAGGTRLEASAAYEGWRDTVAQREVCTPGTAGCPQVASMYGREAATVTGAIEQDFGFWESTAQMKSSGSFVMPFTVESGDLSTYRVVATAQFRDVMLELPDYGLLVDDLDALIPVEQELATYPKLFIVPNRTANAMTQKRFFDLYPFSRRESFFTVDRLQLGQEMVGPLAANVQIVGSTVAVDQVHASYRGGYITGQVLADVGRDDPEVSFRGNITGVETTRGRGVLDANLAMTFVPTTLIVEGKAQVVSVSKDHLYEIIDVLDPYHEDEGLNRVRFGLKFGYPKYVRLNMDEGLMDAKIDLGGLAGAVRIDEIKGIPVTPFIEEYVQPYLERVLLPAPAAQALVAETEGT